MIYYFDFWLFGFGYLTFLTSAAFFLQHCKQNPSLLKSSLWITGPFLIYRIGFFEVICRSGLQKPPLKHVVLKWWCYFYTPPLLSCLNYLRNHSKRMSPCGIFWWIIEAISSQECFYRITLVFLFYLLIILTHRLQCRWTLYFSGEYHRFGCKSHIQVVKMIYWHDGQSRLQFELNLAKFCLSSKSGCWGTFHWCQ